MRQLTLPAARERRRASRGVTLIELMVGLVVLAVLAATAAPYMGDMVVNSRLRESGNTLFTEVLIAQSEAVKRNTNVRVSTDGNAIEVRDMTVPGPDDAGVLLRSRTMATSVTAPTSTITFGPEGRPTPFGTGASVNLLFNGNLDNCTTEIRCPGLRVDAGGAMRLCGNHKDNCS